MGFWMVLVPVGLVILFVWLVGALFPRADRLTVTGGRDLNARQILDRRYVRGEITSAEYERMKQAISDGSR